MGQLLGIAAQERTPCPQGTELAPVRSLSHEKALGFVAFPRGPSLSPESKSQDSTSSVPVTPALS